MRLRTLPQRSGAQEAEKGKVASSLFGVEPLFDVLPDAPVVPMVFFRFPEGCEYVYVRPTLKEG